MATFSKTQTSRIREDADLAFREASRRWVTYGEFAEEVRSWRDTAPDFSTLDEMEACGAIVLSPPPSHEHASVPKEEWHVVSALGLECFIEREGDADYLQRQFEKATRSATDGRRP